MNTGRNISRDKILIVEKQDLDRAAVTTVHGHS